MKIFLYYLEKPSDLREQDIYIDRFGFAMQSITWCQTIPLENILVLEVICN